jgi:putative transcriptional regulator
MSRERPMEQNGAENFLEGKLLIAMPGMADDRFARTVIYMCAHSPQGAMGLVINKPIPGLTFQQLLAQMDIPTGGGFHDRPILFGGPVDTERGFVLHTRDYEAPDATLQVSDEIALTATKDILRAMAEGQGPRDALFALGYAGWGPGQVESEFHDNGWLHCDAETALVLGLEPERKWRAALAKLGVDPTGLSANMGRA